MISDRERGCFNIVHVHCSWHIALQILAHHHDSSLCFRVNTCIFEVNECMVYSQSINNHLPSEHLSKQYSLAATITVSHLDTFGVTTYQANVLCRESCRWKAQIVKTRSTRRINEHTLAIRSELSPMLQLTSVRLGRLVAMLLLGTKSCYAMQAEVVQSVLYYQHVPKTGGTTMSKTFRHEPWFAFAKNPECSNTSHSAMLAKNLCGCKLHTPLHRFTPRTFGVFRDPVDRILSSFTYQNKIFEATDKACSCDSFAQWLVKSIDAFRQNSSYRGCHFILQTTYLRKLEWVLRMDNWQGQLQWLLKKYRLTSKYVNFVNTRNTSSKLCQEHLRQCLVANANVWNVFHGTYADDIRWYASLGARPTHASRMHPFAVNMATNRTPFVVWTW